MPEVYPKDIADLAGLFDDIGLNVKTSAKVIKEAHKAKREGQPDHKIRLEAAKTALGLRGYTMQSMKMKHEGELQVEFIGFAGRKNDKPEEAGE